MIIDTSFLIELLSDNPDAFQKAEELHENDGLQFITPINLYELYYGAIASENANEIRRVNNIATMYQIANMGEEEGKKGAELLANADLREGGDCGVGHKDAMIAGIAANMEETVLAEDDDFDKLDVDWEELP